MMIALAILLLPIRGMFWTLRHPKVLILIVIIVFAFMGFNTCNSMLNKDNANLQPSEFQEAAPSIEKAPFVLATNSRFYYVSKYTDDEQIITLQEYYTYDKKKWRLQTDPLTIDRKYFGEVRLYERKK